VIADVSTFFAWKKYRKCYIPLDRYFNTDSEKELSYALKIK